MSKNWRISCFSGLLLCCSSFLAGCGQLVEDSAVEGDLPEIVGFNDHIRPILTKNCAACHGGVKKSGGLSYVFREEAIAVGLSGNQSIVPGDPDASYLIEKVSSKDPAFRMPPIEHGAPLKTREIGLLRKWIEQGAEWEAHWAFAGVPEVLLPEVDSDWGNNALDVFILDKLEAHQLEPSAPLDRGPLLRRLSLDLTGVPPTEEELAHFLENDAEDAYEQEVDRLLASPRYGERWATMWLDLARYADSRGAGKDSPRTIYKFRDWVIRALNEDMPFDQFTVKQIAGDLLPNASYDDYIATAFHRNTHTEDEGGTNDEEFRVVAVTDRVNTTWQAWLGTTFSCVQCHSHPYDPFRHEEYYKFMAFFNNTQDADTDHDYPILQFPKDEAQQVELGALLAKKERADEANWARSHELTQSTNWQWLKDLKVTTSKDAQMRYRIEAREGREEFVFEGTPAYNTMTVIADAPEKNLAIQAIRFDISPLDLETAPYQPSDGFIVDKLEIFQVSANGETETKLPLDRIFKDEPYPFLWGDVKQDATGFSALSRIFKTRYAVFRLKDPCMLLEGEKLKFVINHGRIGGGKLMILRRGSIGITSSDAWRSLDQSPEWLKDQWSSGDVYQKLREVPKVGIPIMRERPSHLSRGNKVFIRGNWTDIGADVEPGTPHSLHPLSEGDEPARLKMARWLVDKENPLTARVLVSRLWEQLFGTGLVETLEDFGSIGELPSHPELLNYLAHQLMHQYDWKIKPILREIVMSAAYRQEGKASAELLELDPKNRLLARGPRNRMSGEMLRDQVLALSGILNDEMYGEPIKPPLPDGGWSPSHQASGDWVAHTDDRIYRRSIYVHWQRSTPYPMFSAFDAPTRDLCSDRRINSNTPIQPLFTLNDPALFKATQAFGVRIREHSDDLTQNIAYGYRLATTKQIPDAILTELVQLSEEIKAMYPDEEAGMIKRHEAWVRKDLNEKRGYIRKQRDRLVYQAKLKKEDPPDDLPNPESVQRGPEHDFVYTAELAVYDTIASVLLNMDEVLNK